jgi:hypothetical protein
MRGSSIYFYATFQDIADIIPAVEQQYPVNYFISGMFDEVKIIEYKSLFDREDLGYTFGSSTFDSPRFLAMGREHNLEVRPVIQRKGGVKYVIDPLINPKSLVFDMGGVYLKSERILICSNIHTISNDPYIKEILTQYRKRIRETFQSLGSVYVGPQARAFARSGWRLTAAIGSPGMDTIIPD